MEGHEHGISILSLCRRKRPEAVIVGIEIPPMDHGVDRVDGIEILCDKDVGLVFDG